MWIVGTATCHTDFLVPDRDRVTSNNDGGWLDDNVIYYCMALFKNQYPYANGLKSCLDL